MTSTARSGRRRQRGEGGLSQRADGLWVGMIDLGWQVVDGKPKRVRRSVSARTLKDARAKFAALRRQVESGALVGNAPTVEEWLTYWLDNVAVERVRQRTLDGYRGYCRVWLIPHLGRHRLDRLRPEHIRAMYQAMEQAGKSPATRRQAHAILRRALTVAEREGKIARNPAALLDAPPTGTVHEVPLTLAEAQAVLAKAAEGDRLGRWLAALYLGMRQSEALGLRWADVGPDYIYVRAGLQRIKGQGLQLVPPKSKTSQRVIPVPAFVMAQLGEPGQPDAFVFGIGGAPMDPRRDWKEWGELLTAAGVSKRPLRAARTTSATLLMASGVDVKIIAGILGHAQVMVTQQAYMRPDDLMRRQAMRALEAHVRPQSV